MFSISKTLWYWEKENSDGIKGREEKKNASIYTPPIWYEVWSSNNSYNYMNRCRRLRERCTKFISMWINRKSNNSYTWTLNTNIEHFSFFGNGRKQKDHDSFVVIFEFIVYLIDYSYCWNGCFQSISESFAECQLKSTKQCSNESCIRIKTRKWKWPKWVYNLGTRNRKCVRELLCVWDFYSFHRYLLSPFFFVSFIDRQPSQSVTLWKIDRIVFS